MAETMVSWRLEVQRRHPVTDHGDVPAGVEYQALNFQPDLPALGDSHSTRRRKIPRRKSSSAAGILGSSPQAG